ncbi:putative late blight resistance protein homolog R1A-10 [Rhododendron vialii]|uniref:putative late blight resistance protein homolog R1A-10 n=1 Tax=Rhododendron vialii TaxID=182163 RepID=UPI00265E6B98|nr:putative late blight resistance protein homolog R1A-10 [Rhododendron vialii]
MGDTAVDFFLETLKQLLTSSNLDFTIDEKLQLRSLEEEIKYLREFLKITEKKRNKDSEVMKLVMRIRDVVSEAENIVELFVVLVIKADHAADFLREHKDYLSFDLVEKVKKEIKTLTAEVKQIYNENMYDMNGAAVKKLKHSSTESGGGSSSSRGSNPSKVVEEKVVVGFKDEVETLMRKLHDNGEGGLLEIISIVGAAGGGKTTLAREVYDQRLTLETFEIRAWVVVSQDYDKTMKKDLLIRILKSAFPKNHEDYEKIDEDMLGEKLLKCLKGKKYLIVMDDIWRIEAWNDIQRSFPKERKGSKVLFTSRLVDVQPDGVSCVPHCLDRLQESYSWELLQKKVFGMEPCPPKLVDIGKQIAKKCEGLPLAIVAIAGILATEDKTLDVWEEVAKRLSSIIAKKQEGCMEILELSYNHLPLHLKACFLYIGAHPEDYEIPVRELIWLWIAEGFIQQSDARKSLEAVAEDYLIGLIDRSLVMVARKRKSHGGIKACRIHDLLRELCLKKAKEDNFFVKICEAESFSPSTTNKHRRLFGGYQFLRMFSSRLRARYLRSFLSLSLPDYHSYKSNERNLSFFVENFELLRVLHFISARSIGEIGIGDLVHLRYLALTLSPGVPYRTWNSTPFHYLPNLETLNLDVLTNLDKISLPRDIVKMVKLRHLHTKLGIFEYHHVFYNEDNGNMLDSLQTLHRMCMCKHCLRFLERTPNLRKLGLIDGDEDGVLMLPDLEFLKGLEKLSVHGWNPCNWVRSTGLKLPQTLTRLTLGYLGLVWEKLSIILRTLPSLEVLKLLNEACRGPVWDTSELEDLKFSQLKYLKLYLLDIEEWSVSEDQFPRLEVLVIQDCTFLDQIPFEFANLYDLREITVESSSRSAEESAMEIQEEQRSKKGDDDCLNLVFRDNGATNTYTGESIMVCPSLGF